MSVPVDPANFEKCLARIAAKGKISSADALNVLQQVSDHADTLTGGADRYLAAAKELADNIKATAQANRLDAVRNALKATAITDRIRTEGGIGSAHKVLQSVLHWVPGAKRLDSVEGMWHATTKAWQSVVGNKLRQAGLIKAALSQELDREAGNEIWGQRVLGPEPTGPMTPARQLAQILMPALEHARERLNAEGARIGTAVDYVTHTNWNPRQLRLAAGTGKTADEAFAAWWAKDGPRMAEKTFDGLVPAEGETTAEARMRFARSVFDATATGVHMDHPGLSGMAADDNGYVPPAYEGTRNIARGVSQQRTIFWKDAQSWTDHMRDFGGGDSLYAQVMRTLDVSARRVALMKRLGTNPAATLNNVIRRIEEEYRPNIDGLAKFKNKTSGLQNVMGRLDGSLNIPANADRSELLEHLMTLESTAHLGGVSVTHLAAAPFSVSAELAHHGVSHLGAVGRVLKAITTGRGSAETQEIMADAGAYAHGYNLDIQTKFKSEGGVPGYISWATGNFMRMTGLPHFLDALQAKGIKGLLMSKLGGQADRELGGVEVHQQALLRRYGINEGEWDLLRNGKEPTHAEGRRYLTPSDASAADPAKVEALLRERGQITADAKPDAVATAVKKFQWDLGDKYLMYLNDAAEHATVTPGVRERALIYGANRPGSLGFMIARVMSQFKMWPVAAVNQVIGREVGYSLSGKEMASNVGWLLALATVGGAARMSVNDFLVGRPQRDYKNPITLLAALGQGGGLGIYGDFLFGETSRMGASLSSTAGGPIVADADRLYQLYSRFKGDLKTDASKALQHMWPDLAHFGVNHIPFGNLVYLKGALDYMLWYHLYEAASPGWWERTNRRYLKEQGRTMAGYRPGGSIPWTPWGVGATQ